MFKKKFSREAAVLLLVAFTVTQILCLIPGIAYADTSWETVGSAGFSATGAWGAYNADIALDSNNTPYVVFSDNPNGSKATVMKYDGTGWVTVGSAGFSAGYAGYCDIATGSDDTPYVVYEDDGIDSKATVMKFDGTGWVTVGSAGFSTPSVQYTSIALDSNDTAYVVFADSESDYKAAVMKYNGTGWVTVGSAGFSAGISDFDSIAIDSNDVPYVVFKDWGLDQKASVKRFNGTNWESVGEAGCSGDQAGYTSIAIDSGDVPYIAFRDHANGAKATVMKFDGTSWVTVGVAGFSEGDIAELSLAITSDDIPYVAYIDVAHDSKATVMKFDGTSWVTVGEAGFSEGEAGYTSIAVDSDGNPYVVYRDYANGYRATVMRYVTLSTDAETPNIITQPTDSTATVGDAVYLSVEASVTTGILSYQWYSNTVDSNIGGTIIDGATGSSYLVPTTAAGTTYYYCAVTNTDDTATGNTTATAASDAAEVYVTLSTDAETPTIITQPTDSTATVGDAVYLSVEASVTTGILSYQWYSNTVDSNIGGTIVAGATGSSYLVPTTAAGTTYYYCAVTNTDDTAQGNTTATAVSDAAEVAVTGADLAITTTSLPDGVVNSSYSAVLAASGGTEPYTWSAAGLPSGLDINTVTGEVYGIPVSAGTSTVTVTVYDSGSDGDLGSFNLTVRNASSGSGGSSGPVVEPLKITTTYLPEGTVGEFYGQAVSASGGTEPYTWSATGLPEGLSLSSDGIITGIPADEGTATVVLKISDSQNRSITITLSLIINQAPSAEPPEVKAPEVILTDIAGHWAENSIKQAVAQGIISGYPDNTFLPDKGITRGEFVTLLVKAFGLEQKGGPGFADVSGHWASADINTAAFYGIVNGYNSTTFGPDDFITREQLSVMIVRALDLIHVEEETTFNDSGSISPWARSSVATVVKQNIMGGYPDNTFRPLGFTTRAEAVTAIFNALQQR